MWLKILKVVAEYLPTVVKIWVDKKEKKQNGDVG